MGLKVTHLPWGANLSRDTGETRGALHTSVPLLALGTTGPLQESSVTSSGDMYPPPHHHAALQRVLTSLPGGPVSPLSP